MNIALILFSPLFLISFISLFTISSKGMQINRIFNNIPIAIIENSIVISGENDYKEPFFKKKYLETSLKSYLKTTLKNKVDIYKISIIYYYINEFGEAKLDLTDFPKSVQIKLKARYYARFETTASLLFKIGDFNT